MKIKNYLGFLLLGLISLVKVSANDIKSIKMDIYIDNNGNAQITEVWNANLTSGTEGYKPYYNLGNSDIIDYQVTMNNIPFTTKNYWDVDASFDEKSYKAGINYTSDSYELCFGISKYGNNTYTMEYTITDFVTRANDADVVYWTLIPHDLSDKPESVYIKIHSDFAYEDTLDVWGYGYGDRNNEGYAYVYDGYIEMTKEGALDSDEYMVTLIKFPKGTFNTNNIIDEDFDYFYDMAESGAINYHKKTFWDYILIIFSFIFSFLPYLAIFVIVWTIIKNSNKYGTKRLKFNKNAKKLKDVPYFRDLPCNKDIFAGYWISCQYNLIKKQTDFLGAILLKWLKNGNIENVTVQSKFLKKEERAIKLVHANNLSAVELELYNMMLNAAVDGTLESYEFENWCKDNYSKILNWFNKVIDDVTMQYVGTGSIIQNHNTYEVTDVLDNTAKEVAGLKKFLDDFSNIKEREAIEVTLWEEYLMFAQIFGIASKVAKEFKKLYPDVITEEYYNDIMFIHTISYESVKAASVAKSRAESYSSGGGGFSSGGGGGGSFGGGGGGGGFR